MGDDSKTGKSKKNTRSKIFFRICSFRLNKSGQESPINVVGVLALIALAVIFTIVALPHLIKNIFELTSLSSAEVVARDIAGLVTISAAAPNRITLQYRMPAEHEYDVDIEDRFVKVKLENVRYGMRGEAQAKTAIDNIEYHGDNINYIEIEKTFVRGLSVYIIQGNYYPAGEAPSESDGPLFQPPYQVPLSPEPGPSTPPAQQTKYVTEISLTTTTSHSSPYLDVDLSATFTHSDSGKQITVNGFWDGGNNWKIRFVPTTAGTWTYTTTSNDNQLSGKTGSFEYIEPSDTEKVANPNYRGFLKVSSNGRYLTYADDTPFFWMGGTIWRGNRDTMPYATDFKTYVDNRKNKGFTIIQILLGHPIKDDGVNENGPLFTQKYNLINPANFQNFDLRINYILDKGMVPVIFLAWGEDLKDMSLNDLKNYYEYIVARYQAYNVMWCISGEYHYVDDLNKIRGLGNTVHNTDSMGHPTTTHPGPTSQGTTTTADFLGESWIDIHMQQTWHVNERNLMVSDYNKNDGPVVNGEAGYENLWEHDRDRVRKEAWTVYMSGGAGYSYGANGVWNWGNPDEPVNGLDAIHWLGSTDMKYVVTFFSGTEWWKMQPSDGLVNNGYCLAEKGRQYVVYLPSGGNVEVDLGDASGTLNMKWFNPTTGSYSTQTTISGGAKRAVLSPYGNTDAALYIYK